MYVFENICRSNPLDQILSEDVSYNGVGAFTIDGVINMEIPLVNTIHAGRSRYLRAMCPVEASDQYELICYL